MKKPELKEIDCDLGDVETYAYGNVKIHIQQDEDSLNPRVDWDNAWKWYSNHRRYMFDKESDRYLKIDDIYDEDDREEGETTCEAILRQHPEFVDALPIFLLDHSGCHVSLGSFHDPWDSGVGAIAVITWEQAKKEWPNAKDNEDLKKKAYTCLESEVEAYERYITGRVYGYIVENVELREINSCWNFYEDPEEVAREAAAAISMKDLTMKTLGSADILEGLNARGGRYNNIDWTDRIKDGKVYVIGCRVCNWHDSENSSVYFGANELAKDLGYQKGEFEGHTLQVWNEKETSDEG